MIDSQGPTQNVISVVVGATGAIGCEIARGLVDRGHSVIATYHRCPPPDISNVTWIEVDVRSESVASLADAVRLANLPLSTLIYAVGAISTKSSIVDTPNEEWLELFNVNCLGFVRTYRSVSQLARRSGAAVLAISSEAAVRSSALNGPYSVSKSALESAVETLALEEAPHGVRVNALAPSLVKSAVASQLMRRKGIIDTSAYERAQPWGRLLLPSEVAETALWIALHPSMRYASGQVVRLAARTS